MSVQVGLFNFAKPVLLWINVGLMAIFLFHIGLDMPREPLKRELLSLEENHLAII